MLVLAVAAAIGCVLSWLAAVTTVEVAPILKDEPLTTSMQYNPPLIGLALVLATVAGVLAVLGLSSFSPRVTASARRHADARGTNAAARRG